MGRRGHKWPNGTGAPSFPARPPRPPRGLGMRAVRGAGGCRGPAARAQQAPSAARPAGGFHCPEARVLMPQGSLSSGTTRPLQGLFLRPRPGRSRAATQRNAARRFPEAPGFGPPGAGRPCPMWWAESGPGSQAALQCHQSQSLQKKCCPGTGPRRPVPVRLAFAAPEALALPHSTPPQASRWESGPVRLQSLVANPQNPKSRAVCPGQQASKSRLTGWRGEGVRIAGCV